MEWLKLDENGEIQFVSEECKLVPEVQALLTLNYNKQPRDHDGRKKFRAKNELKYLYLAYSLKSPYRDYSEKERIEEAKLDCNLDGSWTPSPELIALIEKYKRGTPGKINRLLTTVTKFIDKFETHLNTVDLNERTATGGLIHSPKAIIDTLERLPRLAETLQELENQAKLGIISKVTSKGDHEVGWMAMQGTGGKPTHVSTTSEDDD
jgi:hypothetical protein